MTIDFVVLYLGLLLVIVQRRTADTLLAIVATPLVGPGAACALVLSRCEAGVASGERRKAE
eukprot:7120711-Prymnesium_polylepis.1